MGRFADVDGYVADCPEPARTVLERIRGLTHSLVPDGEDVIRYDMPTRARDGRSVVHYAAWKKHVSIYPEPSGDADLTADLAPYSGGRGTLKFRLDQPVPYDLVERVVAALARAASS